MIIEIDTMNIFIIFVNVVETIIQVWKHLRELDIR